MSLLQAGLSRRSPVALPAALPARRHRVQLRSAGPVPIGVRMEHRFHRFLQPGRGHGLRDPVRDARDGRFILPLLQARVGMFLDRC
jgi:hypothetical protein